MWRWLQSEQLNRIESKIDAIVARSTDIKRLAQTAARLKAKTDALNAALASAKPGPPRN